MREFTFAVGLTSPASSLIMPLSVSPVSRFDLVSSAEVRSQQQP
jgi:hypothetical protein